MVWWHGFSVYDELVSTTVYVCTRAKTTIRDEIVACLLMILILPISRSFSCETTSSFSITHYCIQPKQSLTSLLEKHSAEGVFLAAASRGWVG